MGAAKVNQSGNTVVVTGGSKGIGLGLAKKFIAEGNKVIVVARSKPDNLDCDFFSCDLTNEDERNLVIDQLLKDHRDTNILINNAGSQNSTNGIENLYTDTKKDIDLNIIAVMHFISGLYPLLKENTNSAIINVSSGYAISPNVYLPIYSASKSFVHSLTMSLRKTLEGSVAVFDLCPPAVKTEMNPHEGMSVDELVKIFWKAWKKNQFFIPVREVKILNLVTRFSKNLGMRLVSKK